MIKHLKYSALVCGVLASSTALFVGGCGEDPEEEGDGTVTVSFQAMVGDKAFTCEDTYEGIGASGASLSVSDFRLYLTNVRLLTSSGEVPLVMAADGKWQYKTETDQTEDVALLDFENGQGSCINGNSDLNAQIVGNVPAGTYTGVKFDLGVPPVLNHGDAAVAPSPLNLSRMFWNWNAGYKFIRLDATTDALEEGFRMHLGSTACTKDDSTDEVTCGNPNRPTIELTGFDPTSETITVDLAALLDGYDLSANAPDTPPGCMSDPADPDCASIFSNLGLMGEQKFFRAP